MWGNSHLLNRSKFMSKRKLLQGRYIRGDIGPTQIDNRTLLPGRDLSGAVSLDGVDQNYDEQSSTQHFTIGSRMLVQDRGYFYSKAVAALVNPITYRLAVSTDQILALNDLLSVAPAGAIGDYTLKVAVGAFQAGAVTLNELVGGYVEIWPVAGGSFMWRKITGNTAVAAGNVTLALDRPINVIVGVGSQVSIHPSVYRKVNSLAGAGLVGFSPAIGLAPIPVSINNYFWLQTYGPAFVGPTGVWPLAVANFYDVYLHGADGTLNSANNEGIAGGGNVSIQRIGHVMGSGSYGSGAIFLELAK
jgi:hypothetical protein